jgi:phosphonoacetate hydrolase
VANAFYAMIDRHLARLDALGAIIAITADHGMKAKHDAQGQANVIYLQSLLDGWLGQGAARVILPITDPYVVHHGALGSFAVIHLANPREAAAIAARLREVAGILSVLPRDEACILYELPPDREGELIVVSQADQTLGTTPERHDLSQLHEPLRSHGGTTEQEIPLLLNRPCQELPAGRMPRNFDAFYLALGRVS